MKQSSQPGLFDVEERSEKLVAMGDPLERLKRIIDWELFRLDLEKVREKARKSNAGAKPFDVVLMFKLLVLQRCYNLSDEQLEYQVRDRLSFMRFLGLQLEHRVPDARTVWAFKEALVRLHLMDALFSRFDAYLDAVGLMAKAGQIVDATFVDVPRQRNRREDNDTLKRGGIPPDWERPEQAAKRRQKDTDARWTSKGGERHYGYKNHVNVDEGHKLIRSYTVTDASVHDSQTLDALLDTESPTRPVYADSAYRSEEQEARLQEQEIQSEIHERAYRNKPLTDAQKVDNRRKSKTRVRVEHVFAAQTQMGGHFIRCIGLARGKLHIGLMNLVYNLKRLEQIVRLKLKPCGMSAPAIP
jgi:IS5 family transposase